MKPSSYDEIERHTVLEPDGSIRPDPPTESDKQIGCAISAALIEHGYDAIGFEVTRGRVILRGSVRDMATASRIKRIVNEALPMR